MASQGQRRDSKHRILHVGESIRANGKYQYKYMVDGSRNSSTVDDWFRQIRSRLEKLLVSRLGKWKRW